MALRTSFPNSSFSYGFGTDVVTGNRFYVDSGAVNASDGNNGLRPGTPFATADAAVGACTALNGDFIYLMPGHVETVTAAGGLTLDIAGITIVFLGEGASRAQVTFTTAVGSDMDVGAEGITLYNPRFVAGIDALTGPIDVNAADFKMFNALVEDAAGIATTDWLVADANADDLLIDGWEYRVSTTGTQKQSNIQIAGATRPVLRNIRITGDFATGNIENGTAWIDATLENIFLDNVDTAPTVAMLLQATSSGQMKNVNLRVASGSIYMTADNNMQFFDSAGVSVDAGGGMPLGSGGHGIRTITKTDAAILTGDDELFTITGGSIHVVSIVGTVTTVIGGASNAHLNCAVTAPAADVSMSTAVAIGSDAEGEVYTFLGPTGILTPGTAGLVLMDYGSTTLTPTQWVVPIGTIEFSNSAAQTGAVTFTMTYYDNPEATVEVAA